jgi:hypothetical protein
VLLAMGLSMLLGGCPADELASATAGASAFRPDPSHARPYRESIPGPEVSPVGPADATGDQAAGDSSESDLSAPAVDDSAAQGVSSTELNAMSDSNDSAEPANPWGENVTLVTLEADGVTEFAGNLSAGEPLDDLWWASNSSVACFPYNYSEFFDGSHVFFALESPQPAHSILRITVEPEDGVDVSLYGYQVSTNYYPVPPDVGSAICEYGAASTIEGPNPGEAESIELHATTNSYNVLFAVVGAEGARSGDFKITIELSDAY